jgi:hypothetical protein
MNNNSPFAAKIICGQCSGYYGSKVWHSTNKYKTRLWRCNRKYEDDVPCDTPHIRECELRSAFVWAFNRIIGDKSHYIAQLEELLPLLADTSTLESKLAEAQAAYDAICERMRHFVEENTRFVQDQGEYELQFREMSREYKKAERLVIKIKDEILERCARKEKTKRFLNELKQTGDIVTEFDKSLWQATVESVTIYKNKTLTFVFRDGTEIPAKL